ncbi:MAG: hypothetical protein V7K82_28440 [Nostoc sp.]
MLGSIAIAIGVGSLPKIIAAASSAWVLFIALARFFNAMPMSRKHSWAFSDRKKGMLSVERSLNGIVAERKPIP